MGFFNRNDDNKIKSVMDGDYCKQLKKQIESKPKEFCATSLQVDVQISKIYKNTSKDKAKEIADILAQKWKEEVDNKISEIIGEFCEKYELIPQYYKSKCFNSSLIELVSKNELTRITDKMMEDI